MPDYDGLQKKKAQLIRKPLDGSFFIAGYGAPLIAAITDATGQLVALPTTAAAGVMKWDDLGYLTTDGMQHAREVTQSDITSFGALTPTRTDITADTTTVTVAAQETKLSTIGLATGHDMTAVIPKAGGEVILKKPARPSGKLYRGLSLAVDLTDAGEIYIARSFPKLKVTSFADQPFGTGDQALLWGTTMTGQFDNTVGYSEAWHFGGPGWRALLTEMGFPAEAAAA